jgi:hypothetical protein
MSLYVSSQKICNTYLHNFTHLTLVKNQALSFLMHYMFVLFRIFFFITTILSPSLLFKILMASPYFGLDSRLDFQLDPTYLLQLRKFNEIFLRLCYLQNNSMHWKFEMKTYSKTICNSPLAYFCQLAIFLPLVDLIS